MTLQTECGLILLITKTKINYFLLINLLKKLQHRGRESFGIGYDNDNKINVNNKFFIVN